MCHRFLQLSSSLTTQLWGLHTGFWWIPTSSISLFRINWIYRRRCWTACTRNARLVSRTVMAELEKLGQKYRVALRIAQDPRFERVPCVHKGTYADDCIVEKATKHKCYIVATCDRDLKRRIRKIPGVPIMYITQHKYSIERLPESTVGGAPRY